MNKKYLKIAGVIAIILGTIALFISGVSESVIAGVVSAVIVLIIAVLAIFQSDIGKLAEDAEEKAEKVKDILKN